jgi:hypothetical protein
VCEEEFGPYQLDGSDPVDAFIIWMQHILKHNWVCTLDTMLIGILAQWWDMHQEHLREWEAVQDSIRERFRQISIGTCVLVKGVG